MRAVLETRFLRRSGQAEFSGSGKLTVGQTASNTSVAVDKATGEERFASNTPFDLYAANEKDGIIYGANKTGLVVAIRPVLIPGQVGVLVMNDDWLFIVPSTVPAKWNACDWAAKLMDRVSV